MEYFRYVCDAIGVIINRYFHNRIKNRTAL